MGWNNWVWWLGEVRALAELLKKTYVSDREKEEVP